MSGIPSPLSPDLVTFGAENGVKMCDSRRCRRVRGATE